MWTVFKSIDDEWSNKVEKKFKKKYEKPIYRPSAGVLRNPQTLNGRSIGELLIRQRIIEFGPKQKVPLWNLEAPTSLKEVFRGYFL